MGTKGKGYKGRWKEGNRGSGVMLAEGKSEFNFNIFNSSKPCHYIYITYTATLNGLTMKTREIIQSDGEIEKIDILVVS